MNWLKHWWGRRRVLFPPLPDLGSQWAYTGRCIYISQERKRNSKEWWIEYTMEYTAPFPHRNHRGDTAPFINYHYTYDTDGPDPLHHQREFTLEVESVSASGSVQFHLVQEAFRWSDIARHLRPINTETA